MEGKWKVVLGFSSKTLERHARFDLDLSLKLNVTECYDYQAGVVVRYAHVQIFTVRIADLITLRNDGTDN